MITYETGLYIRIEELVGPRAPVPRPLENSFSTGLAYRVLGLYSPSETSEAYFVLSNDRDEIWFISNRHVRTIGIQPSGSFRLPLSNFAEPYS